MNLFESIILGIIQGLTEFIPVSSSGHLVIGQWFFSGASAHLFIEFINIGTLLALLVYFRRRIVAIVRDIFQNRNYALFRNILITSVPAGIVGYFLSDFIATAPFFGSVLTVTVTLAVVGIVMIVLEKLPKAAPVKDGEKLTPGKALLVGVAQMLALIPGVSRSGATIITGRLAGLSPASAAEYSFLASLPIMLGVTLKLFVKESDRIYFTDHLPIMIASNIAAFIAGLVAVGFLMRYLSKHSLAVFGWYRLALAAVLALTLLVQ